MPLSDLADIATALGATLAGFGLILLFVQIRLQYKEQKKQAVSELFNDLLTLDFRRKMMFLYSREPEQLRLEKTSVSERELIDEVTSQFDRIGFKVRNNLFPKSETMELFRDWVIRSAQQLQFYIEDQGARRGDCDPYRMDFEWLAKECKFYQLRKMQRKLPNRNIPLSQLLKNEPYAIFKIDDGEGKDKREDRIR